MLLKRIFCIFLHKSESIIRSSWFLSATFSTVFCILLGCCTWRQKACSATASCLCPCAVACVPTCCRSSNTHAICHADQEMAHRVKMLEQRLALRHVDVAGAAPAEFATAPDQVELAPALVSEPATAPTDTMSPITSFTSDGDGMMLGEVHMVCHAPCTLPSGAEGMYPVTFGICLCSLGFVMLTTVI